MLRQREGVLLWTCKNYCHIKNIQFILWVISQDSEEHADDIDAIQPCIILSVSGLLDMLQSSSLHLPNNATIFNGVVQHSVAVIRVLDCHSGKPTECVAVFITVSQCHSVSQWEREGWNSPNCALVKYHLLVRERADEQMSRWAEEFLHPDCRPFLPLLLLLKLLVARRRASILKCI